MKFNKRKVGNKIAYNKNAASDKSIYTHKQRKRERAFPNLYGFGGSDPRVSVDVPKSIRIRANQR